MEIDLKKYNFNWLPMLLLLLSGGSLSFVFFRKELLFLIFFYFLILFFISGLYKNELIKFFQLLSLFTTLLLVNFYFADIEQSFQKLFANLLIFTSSIFAALYYSRDENKIKFISHIRTVLKFILLHKHKVPSSSRVYFAAQFN